MEVAAANIDFHEHGDKYHYDAEGFPYTLG